MSAISLTNRNEANELVDRQGRVQAIIRIMTEFGLPMTARMIMEKLGTQDPNMVRPRLTEMAKEGTIRALSEPVKENGRNVTQYELKHSAKRLTTAKNGQIGFDLWRL